MFVRSSAFATSFLLLLGTISNIREPLEGELSDRRSFVCAALNDTQDYSFCLTLEAGTVLWHSRATHLVHLPGTLELHNQQFEQVRVEVSIGASGNCDENAIQGPATLRQNQTWAVVSEQVVCWRRDQVPGDSSSGWTAWVQVQLSADELRVVTL